MEWTHLLLRPGEIFLKGKNQRIFENKLANNIKKITGQEVKKLRFRFLLDYFPEHEVIKQVFGLTSYSCVVRVERSDNELEMIKKVAGQLVAEKLSNGDKKLFKVETKRSDKSFSLKSPDLNQEVGIFVQELYENLELSFKKPEFVLKIEINQEGIYLFTESIPCFGGLPTGVEGKVILLIDNSSVRAEEASNLAGLLFMKRGCDLLPVTISEEGAEITLLQKYSPLNLQLRTVSNLAEIKKLPEFDIVVGQNYDHYQEIKVGDNEKLIFRPLISYSDEIIKKKLREFK